MFFTSCKEPMFPRENSTWEDWFFVMCKGKTAVKILKNEGKKYQKNYKIKAIEKFKTTEIVKLKKSCFFFLKSELKWIKFK